MAVGIGIGTVGVVRGTGIVVVVKGRIGVGISTGGTKVVMVMFKESIVFKGSIGI